MCNEIIKDETTPDAVLLAEGSAIFRMYPNGTTEDLVGNISFHGWVPVFKMIECTICLFKCE